MKNYSKISVMASPIQAFGYWMCSFWQIVGALFQHTLQNFGSKIDKIPETTKYFPKLNL